MVRKCLVFGETCRAVAQQASLILANIIGWQLFLVDLSSLHSQWKHLKDTMSPLHLGKSQSVSTASRALHRRPLLFFGRFPNIWCPWNSVGTEFLRIFYCCISDPPSDLTLSNRHNTIVLVGKNDVARLFFIIIWISRPVSLVRFPSFQDLPLDGRSVVYSAVGRGQQWRLDGESETYFSKCFFLYNFFKFWYNWCIYLLIKSKIRHIGWKKQ
jgi:hypothetical protein